MIRKRQKKKGLRAKIKDYMDDVSIDLFDYEKKATLHFVSYLKTISKEYKTPTSSINIRISRSPQGLQAHIYCFNNWLRQISFQELTDFFMDKGTAEVFDLEVKVKQNINAYLATFAKEKGLPIENLNVRIFKPSDHVVVIIYNHRSQVEHIPLKRLIKYFKG